MGSSTALIKVCIIRIFLLDLAIYYTIITFCLSSLIISHFPILFHQACHDFCTSDIGFSMPAFLFLLCTRALSDSLQSLHNIFSRDNLFRISSAFAIIIGYFYDVKGLRKTKECICSGVSTNCSGVQLKQDRTMIAGCQANENGMKLSFIFPRNGCSTYFFPGNVPIFNFYFEPYKNTLASIAICRILYKFHLT